MKFWSLVYAYIKNDNEKLRTSLKMLKYQKVLFQLFDKEEEEEEEEEKEEEEEVESVAFKYHFL